jgi:hypothetical protein
MSVWGACGKKKKEEEKKGKRSCEGCESSMFVKLYVLF